MPTTSRPPRGPARARRFRAPAPWRVAAWAVTGPLGHLVGGVLDIAILGGRWAAGRARARVIRRIARIRQATR